MMTDVVTERNFEQVYPKAVRDRFWHCVKRGLSDVFNSPTAPADRYRQKIESAPVQKRLFVYHEEPLKIAADLAGVAEISEEQQRLYRELVGSDEPAIPGLPDSP